MKFNYFSVFLLLTLVSCGQSTTDEIYNENNTRVINGIVYDIKEKPINGIYKTYYPDGNVRMEVSSRNGLPNGEGKFYDEDGILCYTVSFSQGQLDGTLYNYYTNGQIHNELNYRAGVMHGTQKIFTDQGELITEVEYENGKAVKGYTIIENENINFSEEELLKL
mgnify:CR=1 FL=1